MPQGQQYKQLGAGGYGRHQVNDSSVDNSLYGTRLTYKYL